MDTRAREPIKSNSNGNALVMIRVKLEPDLSAPPAISPFPREPSSQANNYGNYGPDRNNKSSLDILS
jgi:hypothetical protein